MSPGIPRAMPGEPVPIKPSHPAGGFRLERRARNVATGVIPNVTFPFVNFRVTISKSKAATVIVHRAHIIHRIRLRRNDRDSRIIDRPRIVIGKSPDFRRAGRDEVRHPAEGGIRRIGNVSVIAIEPGPVGLLIRSKPGISPHTLVQRNTANHLDRLTQLRRVGSAVGTFARIARTLEYRAAFSQVRGQ